MRIPIYQVDAFASRAFEGNPAAVCPLGDWLPDATMQAIALENNLSETAFLVPEGEDWRLRWFTPQAEVELCGHATLASAFVLFRLHPERDAVRFLTRSGPLSVRRAGELYEMDFPSQPGVACELPEALRAGLGGRPVEVRRNRDYWLAVYASEAEVAALAPDMAALARDERGFVATAGSDGADFVSRMFAPCVGIPEDPVCGSAHCLLTPYWAERLGRDELRARQISSRGGDLLCALDGERVRIAGGAVLVLEGALILEPAAAPRRAGAAGR